VTVATMGFDLFPAIDLKDGACVRLKQGRMEEATVYGADPAAMARRFADAGARWLHVVDLNGAFAGNPQNREAIAAIVAACPELAIQLGGGVRDAATVASYLELGVTRLILGTVAARDPALLRELARAFPGRIVVGIDAREGQVAVAGWAETETLAATELARCYADAGVAAIVFTDIGRDGMLTGVNVVATAALAEACGLPVIASGGVRDLDDLRALLAVRERGVAGMIAGRALYEGTLDLAAALDLLEAG